MGEEPLQHHGRLVHVTALLECHRLLFCMLHQDHRQSPSKLVSNLVQPVRKRGLQQYYMPWLVLLHAVAGFTQDGHAAADPFAILPMTFAQLQLSHLTLSYFFRHLYTYDVDSTVPETSPNQVFPFVHTFPAHDESRRTWIESTCNRCPATSALLRRVPNIRTALFSRLGGGSRISGHRGWADLANHVLRCHLPLKVPADGPCGLWVNEEVYMRVVLLVCSVFAAADSITCSCAQVVLC